MLGHLSHAQSNTHTQDILISALQDHVLEFYVKSLIIFSIITFIAIFNLIMFLNLYSLVTLHNFLTSLYLKHLVKRPCNVIHGGS